MYLSEIKKLDKEYIAHTYNRLELGVQSGSGECLTDVGGKRYIDFSSGIGVSSLGYGNPAWVEAVKAQVDTLAHISNYFYTQPMVSLAKALCERTGMQRAFFCNSGGEANEGMIKTARKYGSSKYGPARHEIITLQNSFHGRTIATLAATGQDGMHRDFGPFPAGFRYAEANNLDDLMANVNDNTCAIMVELIQGEGGVIPLEKEFVEGIAAVCKERDILLAVDEIQTGVGRTGRFACYQHFGLKPDIVSFAKGLGGGLPIGAVLFGEKTKDTLIAGDHGSTFGGNPVVCAGAVAVMESIDGKFLDAVTEKGEYLAKQLAALDGVTGVAGRGLMLGAVLEQPLQSGEVMQACLKQGLVVLTAKDRVRLLPPLTISKGEIDEGIKILGEVLAALKQQAAEAEAERQ